MEQVEAFFRHFNVERNTPEALRDGMLCRIGIAGMMRHDEYSKSRLQDWSLYDMEQEGSTTPFRVFDLVLLHGKTNQFEETERASMVRHRNVAVCPVTWLALWLFTRFQMQGESFNDSDDGFPAMKKRSDWYNEHLTPAPQDREKPLPYTTHLAAVDKALIHAEVVSSSKTHLMRKLGARRAESAGVPESEIIRHGRWKNGQQVLENVYLTHMSLPTLRAMAGFRQDGQSDYHLARYLPVPEELRKKVFPQLDSR